VRDVPRQEAEYDITPFNSSWQEQYDAASYTPDQTASTTLQFHRVDDPLYSIVDDQVTSRDMLAYRTHSEYAALVNIA
jgi:tyrosinase